MPVLSRHLEETLAYAIREADLRRHEYVTLEHVLLGLLNDPDVFAIFRDTREKLCKNLSGYIDKHPSIKSSDAAATEAAFDPGVQHVIQCAHHGALTFGHEIVTGAHVLWKLSLEPEGYAATMLRDHGMMGYKVREFIARQPASGAGEGRGYIPPEVAARISGLVHPAPGDEDGAKISQVMGVAARLRMVLEGCDPDVGAAAMKFLPTHFRL